MTISELKELLLIEHKRDKKLTLINYGLISIVILSVSCILMYFLRMQTFIVVKDMLSATKNNEYGWYYMIVMPIAFGIVILYPFYKVWQISIRPKRIDELLDKVSSGSVVTTVENTTEYKITIPLFIVRTNLKICPVSYAHIYLNNDVKGYVLPLRKVHIPEVKLILSGANMEKLNQVRHALYSEETSPNVPQSTLATPVKSVEEFKQFVQSALSEKITEFEEHRKYGRSNMWIFGGISAVFVIMFIVYMIYTSFNVLDVGNYSQNPFTIIIPILIVSVLFSLGMNYYAKMKQKKLTFVSFKQEVCENYL